MQVTVYTKPSCQPCRAAKRKLSELDIEFTEKQLDDPARFMAMGFLSAPVTEVDLGGGAFWHWSGYAPSQIETLDHILSCDDPVCSRCESAI